MKLNARGKACPMPVVMALKELEGGCRDLVVEVDNAIAVENLTRLGEGRGMTVSVAEGGGTYAVRLTGGAPAAEPGADAQPANGIYANGAHAVGGYAVFVGKDHVGEGAGELGRNLMKMALYTLANGEEPPAFVLFMNGGVSLPAGEDTGVLESLNKLIEKGAEVLVCGTCLDYYGLKESLKAGTVSNMYEILERMRRAAKVITL